MSRFNESTVGKTKTVNKAGGAAYKMTPEMELVNLLLTSFATDGFYESAKDQVSRLKSLMQKVDPLFAAKAAVYARNVFNMRTITHVAAGELSVLASGTKWAKRFFDKIVVRPDDMLEIASYIADGDGKLKLSAAMKKGFAQALSRFDGYQLSKYRGEGKKVKLVDLVNLVHSKGISNKRVSVNVSEYSNKLKALADSTKSEEKRVSYLERLNWVASFNENSRGLEISPLEALTLGLLKSDDTWNTRLTKAGQNAGGDKEKKQQAKTEAWSDLLKQNKLPYMVLLKNIRNILTDVPEMVDILCKQLTIPQKVKKSRVLPFRFISVIKELEKLSIQGVRKTISALNTALEISFENVPNLGKNVLVVLDDSGSMTWSNVAGTKVKCSEIGALFAAIIWKSHDDADFMTFASNAKYRTLNPSDSVLSLARMRFDGGGTNFHAMWKVMNRVYDTIIIISDQEGWMGMKTGNPAPSFAEYKRKFNVNPRVFAFNLANSGSMMFPENNVFITAGFSEKSLEMLSLLSKDRRALVSEINKVEI